MKSGREATSISIGGDGYGRGAEVTPPSPPVEMEV
ncbi:hypothetical protein A2U01_0071996 [Trifolium medium]|uniref:Uncharacterized protein n=1 Tax=Trifolium medium TaxID=97028 RepID=A0A392SQQ6_9FABA|nr:hypothetical protein [Trifolium medium]